MTSFGDWLQQLMVAQQVTTVDNTSHDVGHVIIDDAMVIYDLNAKPEWLGPLMEAQDE